MQITRLAYLGPAGSKTVTGIEFPRHIPIAVSPAQAKTILRHWPASFVGLMDCPNCSQVSPAPQEEALPVEEAQPDEPEAEATPEPVKKNKGGRPRKE